MIVDDRADSVRVLVVDDDPRVRAALRAFLDASPGFHVVGVAATAEAAYDLAQRLAPHVALIDVLLSDSHDGLALLRAITRDLELPVIAMSIDGGLRASALAAGATRFLEKDRTPDLVLSVLRDLASPQRQLPQP